MTNRKIVDPRFVRRAADEFAFVDGECERTPGRCHRRNFFSCMAQRIEIIVNSPLKTVEQFCGCKILFFTFYRLYV